MYVYYDRAGNLKEIINEPVRSGDLYSKDILVYWDNHPSINTFNAKVRTSDGVVTNVELISSTEVQLTIPYNQDRDLKFFKYNTPYKFFKYTPANTFPSGQTEVAFYFQYGGSWDQDHTVLSDYRVVVLQILPFYVEETNDLSLGDNINQTQWSCLLNSLKMNNVRAYENVPSSVELDNLGANSLIFNYGDNCVYKVILDPTYTPTDTDIEVDPYVLQLVAIMTPISSEYPISADLVDDTDSEHKFVTAQDLDMIGKIPENILTGTTQFFPVLMADTITSNTNTNHNGGAYRTNLVYINSANGFVYAPKFYQGGNEVQDKLVSGTNIKTINGASVLGSGDMTVTASASWGSIIGTLSNQTDLQNALNGKQDTLSGTNRLNPEYIATDTTHRFCTDGEKYIYDHKQDALVSGTNIKTINSTSVLGSGNISVQPVIDSEHPLGADLVDDTTSTNKFVSASDITNWNGKQNALTFDNTPTQNSTNPVTSGGVYSAINSAISGVYVYKGSLTVEQINALVVSTLDSGFVYNALDSGTITTGLSNLPVVEGDNVAWDLDSTSFEKLTGIVDLSGYQPLIDSTHKLSADLVDDTSTTHKFVTTQTAYTSKGSATKVPQITTNTLGQVTSITEVTITQPTVNDATLTITQNGVSKGTFTANASSNNTIALTDTTYENKSAENGGTAVSLVTTGEKYTWNGKSVVSVSNTGTATNEVSYITINGTEKKLAGGINDYEVIVRESLPTANETSPDFVQLSSGELYRKKGIAGVVTDLTGTSWQFGDTISGYHFYGTYSNGFNEGAYSITFTSTNISSNISQPFNEIRLTKETDNISSPPVNKARLKFGSSDMYYSSKSGWSVGYNSDLTRYIFNTTANPTITITGGSSVTNATLINWLTENATLVAGPLSYSYEIISDTTYEKASSSALGLVKVSATANAQTLQSVSTTADRQYAVQVDTNGVASVNVPWSSYDFDTDANILSLVDELFAEYSISVSVTNGTYSGANSIKAYNGTATINVSANAGYTLPDSITVTGASYTYNDGTIVLSEPTGNVSISVVCEQETPSGYSVSITDSSNFSVVSIYDGTDNTGTLLYNGFIDSGQMVIVTSGNLYIKPGLMIDYWSTTTTGGVTKTSGNNYGILFTVTGDGTIATETLD